MLFNSFTYLLFFPITTLLYFIIPNRFRWGYLLLVSYGFYMNWNPAYALLLLFVTFVSYYTALNRKKWILVFGIFLNLIPLIIFKYLNFFNESVFSLMDYLGIKIQMPEFNLLLPVGISFFTFKGISYIVDVYKGKISAEKNIGIFALYISLWILLPDQ